MARGGQGKLAFSPLLERTSKRQTPVHIVAHALFSESSQGQTPFRGIHACERK